MSVLDVYLCYYEVADFTLGLVLAPLASLNILKPRHPRSTCTHCPRSPSLQTQPNVNNSPDLRRWEICVCFVWESRGRWPFTRLIQSIGTFVLMEILSRISIAVSEVVFRLFWRRARVGRTPNKRYKSFSH